MTNDPVSDFTEFIKKELKNRIERNPKYSLRALARDFAVSPALLSRILGGKAAPSKALATKIGVKFGFKDEKLNWFIALVESRYGKNPATTAAAQALVNRYAEGIVTKQVKVKNSIDWDWYHFTLRRLTQLKNFKTNFDWIAKAVGISKVQVKKAIDELLFAGALSMVDGQLKLSDNYSVYYEGDKTLLRTKMEKALFSRKIKSVLAAERERSHHARHFFALNNEQVQELKELIRTFENKVDDLTYKSEDLDEVYLLSVDFCALTKAK